MTRTRGAHRTSGAAPAGIRSGTAVGFRVGRRVGSPVAPPRTRPVGMLVARARRGDRGAIRALDAQYLPRLARLAGALVFDPQDARRVARAALRAALSEQDVPYFTAAVHCVQRLAAAQQRPAVVDPALAGIDRVGRLVLVLMDLDGHSATRTGELLGMSPDVVREHHHQARAQLGLSAPTSTCRGWLLVSRWDHLSAREQEAAHKHLLLCRPCRDEQEARSAVRRRLAVALPLAAAATGIGTLVASAPAWLAPLVIAIGAGAGAIGLGLGLGLGSGGEQLDVREPVPSRPGAHVEAGPDAPPPAVPALLVPRPADQEPLAVVPAVPPGAPRPTGADDGPVGNERPSVPEAPTRIGHVSLTDDAGGVAKFAVTDMVPGSTALRSITVTNAGSLPLDVRLYSTEPSGHALAQYVHLTIGTTRAGSDVFDGTMADFAGNHGSYSEGTAPIRLAIGATQTYYFWTQLDADTPAAFQNARAAVDFVWRGQAP